MKWQEMYETVKSQKGLTDYQAGEAMGLDRQQTRGRLNHGTLSMDCMLRLIRHCGLKLRILNPQSGESLTVD